MGPEKPLLHSTRYVVKVYASSKQSLWRRRGSPVAMGLDSLISSSAERESYHKQAINMKAEVRRLLSNILPFIAFPPLALALIQLEKLGRTYECFKFLQIDALGGAFPALLGFAFLLLCVLLNYFWLAYKPIYLLDFSCYRAPDGRKLPMNDFMEKSELVGKFTAESLDFQKKILQRSGIGQEIYFPRAVTNLQRSPILSQ